MTKLPLGPCHPPPAGLETKVPFTRKRKCVLKPLRASWRNGKGLASGGGRGEKKGGKGEEGRGEREKEMRNRSK